MAGTKTLQLREAFKLALSMVLFYWLALWMNWDMPKYGALAIALICLGTAGASLQKGILRVVGTTVGLAVGMLMLALFAQDRWPMMVALAAWLLVVSYFMPVSRYGYAWFVAGFLPPLVWSTTYGDVNNAFHYASFRYLETSAGILIYTIVTALLWPRRAGEDLNRLGSEYWSGVGELFGMYRRQLERGDLPAEASELRMRLAGTVAQLAATLQAASADTPSVARDKRAWKVLQSNVRAFSEALVLWRESIDDCRHLAPDRRLPGLPAGLDTIGRRLARISELWESRAATSSVQDAPDRDGPLLGALQLKSSENALADLAHFDRAALLGFLQQLRLLDVSSRAALHTMRVLAALEPMEHLDTRPRPSELYPPSRWDPARLVNAAFPALCFIAAWLFWIYANPPTGSGVPNMAATMSLVIVLTPMNALVLIPLMLGVMWIAVAPIYLFVMPHLDTGAGLLALIFGYTFLASLVGARSPSLKMMLLALFVMMTGISNDQAYSFIGLVDGGLMIFLAIAIIAVVQMLLGPVRPEQQALQVVRRFFRGCARMTGAFAPTGPGRRARTHVLRKRWFESMVQPAPRRLRAITGKMDPALLPDHERDRVRGVIDAMQTLVFRLQALEVAQKRLARRPVEWAEPLVGIGRQLRERLQGTFERWSYLQPVDAPEEGAAVRELGRRLQEQLDDPAHSEDLDDQTLADLYAMLGCARGLVHATAEMHGAVAGIDLDHWAEARF